LFNSTVETKFWQKGYMQFDFLKRFEVKNGPEFNLLHDFSDLKSYSSQRIFLANSLFFRKSAGESQDY